MILFIIAALHTVPIFAHHRAAAAHRQAQGRQQALSSRGGFRPCWVTSNWEPGSRNADGSFFQRGIAAAPISVPYHSVVIIRFRSGRAQRVIAADREKHGRLHGKPHFDLARPGDRSEDAVYKIVHIGDGKYRKSND